MHDKLSPLALRDDESDAPIVANDTAPLSRNKEVILSILDAKAPASAAPKAPTDNTGIANQLKNHPEKYADPGFYKDMYELFTQKRAGHAFHHVMTGKALNLWEQFTRAADTEYYLFNNEANLIRENADYFASLAKKEGTEHPLIMIELGTGSAHSIKHKTMPFVDAIHPDIYVGVDYSTESATEAVMKVHAEHPETTGLIRLKDFNKQNLQLEESIYAEIQKEQPIKWNVRDLRYGRRIMVQFGGTLGNVEGFAKDGLPHDHLKEALTNYRRHLHPGDYFIIGLDHNQNARSLASCYQSDLIAQFSMATLARMKEELPVKYFDPDDFEYSNRWIEESHLYAHGFRAKKTGSFYLGRERISYNEGDCFIYCNSYKYPQDFLDQVFAETGFTQVKVMKDRDKRVHLHTLQAIEL